MTADLQQSAVVTDVSFRIGRQVSGIVRLDFSVVFRNGCGMETDAQRAAKQAHGKALREALAAHPEADRFDLEAVTGRGYRTVTNWLNGHNMPDETAKSAMRRLLGNYEAAGDPVERAIRRSELIDWRQNRLLSIYQEYLAEQRAEKAG